MLMHRTAGVTAGEQFHAIIPEGRRGGDVVEATLTSGRKVKVKLPGPRTKDCSGLELSFRAFIEPEQKTTPSSHSDPKLVFDTIDSDQIIRLGLFATDAAFHAREAALMEIISRYFSSEAPGDVVLSLPMSFTYGNVDIKATAVKTGLVKLKNLKVRISYLYLFAATLFFVTFFRLLFD